MRTRFLSSLLVLALVVAVSGCGGDDKNSSSDAAASQTDTAAAPETTPQAHTRTEPATSQTDTSPSGSQKNSAGGTGGAEPKRTLAQFTGRGGRVTPRLIYVPPYIPIRIELRSADGKTYEMQFGAKTLKVGGEIASASSTFEELIPNAQLYGRPVRGVQSTVTVAAKNITGP